MSQTPDTEPAPPDHGEPSTHALSAVRLAPGITLEHVGSECLALVGQQVVRITGPAASVLAAVHASHAGPAADLTIEAGEVHAAVDLLVDLGVLERTATPAATAAAPATVSRRRALGVAAGGAALGATVLVLPQAAAAASELAGTEGSTLPPAEEPPDAPSNVTFTDPTDDGFTVTWDPSTT